MYLGVIKELYNSRDILDLEKLRIYGSSSGSFMGFICLLVLHELLDIDTITKMIQQCFNNSSILQRINITQMCIDSLELLFAQIKHWETDALILANKHLYVAVSQPARFIFIHEFDNITMMKHIFMLSSNLILISSYPAYYQNTITIDGGYRMRSHDLPEECLMIYNYGIQFPECIVIPPEKEQNELITKGHTYLKQKKTASRCAEDDDWCFYKYTELELWLFFSIQQMWYKNNRIGYN